MGVGEAEEGGVEGARYGADDRRVLLDGQKFALVLDELFRQVDFVIRAWSQATLVNDLRLRDADGPSPQCKKSPPLRSRVRLPLKIASAAISSKTPASGDCGAVKIGRK